MSIHICIACGFPDESNDRRRECSRCESEGRYVDLSAAPPAVLVASVEFLWRTLLALQNRVEELSSRIDA